MAARSATKRQSGSTVAVEQTTQKAADALEQLVTLTGNNDSDRKLLRASLFELLNYGRNGNKLLHTAEQILQEEVAATQEERRNHSQAEIRDKDQRREAELAEANEHRIGKEGREDKSQQRKDERHKQDMREREAALERENECHDQAMRERETNLKDNSRERNLFMTLTAANVIATIFFGACTVVFLFLTAKYSQPWGYAASGASLGLAAITGLTGGTPERFRTLFSLAKSGGEGKGQKGESD